MIRSRLFNRISIYKNYFYSAALIVFSAIALSSCYTTKKSYFFQTLKKDTIISAIAVKGAELVIKKNDLIQVSISSLNSAEDAGFNATGVAIASSPSSGYLVDMEGNIHLHKLGVVHAEGLTRAGLKDKLQKDLLPFLKDPVVTVSFLNHYIIVMGEIGNTQVLTMPEEQISILELMAKSGGVTQYGRKDNILIIRDSGNTKQFKHINLEDVSIFTSPWYWLQPGDLVDIRPNDRKTFEQKNANAQQIISYGLTGLSLALILLERILR